MITRKIGKILRGKATPVQLMMACVLGSLIGFVPGFMQGPGWTVLLLLLLVILNANLFVAAVVGFAAKGICLLALPASVSIGRVLLDGPTQELFKWVINTPVLALFGFEYYATTGGIVLGLLFGIVSGLLIIALVQRFRRRMAALEAGSEKYKRWSSRRSVRVATYVFLGKGKGKKKSYEDLLSKRVGSPIRALGVIIAVGFIALCALLYMLAAEPIVTALMQRGLERANGATVNLESANLDFRAGRMELRGLAMADPNDLATDLLRAEQLIGAISTTDLLRKRMALDDVQMINASTGEQRAVPGRLVRKPEPVNPEDDPTTPDEQEQTLEDYIEQAEEWKERLAQIRDWLETVSGSTDDDETVETEEGKERLEDRIRRQIREHGYARVRADHLIDDAPTFVIYNLRAEGVRTAQLEGETLTITGRNLSTHPHLMDEPADIYVESSGETLLARASLVPRTLGGQSTLQFRYIGLPVDTIAGWLRGGAPMQSGTVDIDSSGTWNAVDATIDLPLNITLRDTALSIGSSSPQQIDRLDLPLGVRGRIDNPLITFSDQLLADALIEAGHRELANRLGSEADELIDRARDEIDDAIGDKIKDQIGDEIGNRLRDDAGNRIRDGLGGLLGGNKGSTKDDDDG